MHGQVPFSIKDFFNSPVFLSILYSWLSAQFIKTIVALFAGKVKKPTDFFALLFWRTGGMPSSHSALVTAISTAIGFSSGFTSDVFMLALAFTFVTVRDALGVRRSTGIQAKAINDLGSELQKKGLAPYTKIKEVNGHKPLEVIMGCLLGIFIGTAFSIL
ncbi:MAG: divergent PAP2 family protein [Treponemataceae bacterium]|nr:divergent PAP2 family protein [Treponemataceae bacterium]